MKSRKPRFLPWLLIGWAVWAFTSCVGGIRACDSSTSSGQPPPTISPEGEANSGIWMPADPSQRWLPITWEEGFNPRDPAQLAYAQREAGLQGSVVAATSDAPVLLDFNATWCEPCNSMRPIVASLQQAGWNVEPVDVDQNKSLAAQYRISSIPCFVMVVGGREMQRIVGATSAEALVGLFPCRQSSVVSGQSPQPTADGGRGTTGIVPDWSRCPPVRQAANGTLLAEIDAHMPAGHQYRDADLITWAHETTHGIASRMRQEANRPGLNAFYCCGDRAIYLAEPRLRKSDVAARVPGALRGDVFGLYMSGQQEWDDCPLYVLDEWTAYCNGAAVGLQYGPGRIGNRSFGADVRHCLEFAGYATALLHAVDDLAPNYGDRQRLQDFVAWQTNRSFQIADSAAQSFGRDASCDRFRSLLADAYNARPEVLQCCDGGNCQWQGRRWLAPRLFSPPIVRQPGMQIVTRPVQKSPDASSNPVPGPVPPKITNGTPVAPPAPNPPTVPPNPAPVPSPDSSSIDARFNKLESMIGAIKPVPGPKGDKGDPGPAGPSGPAGPQGAGVDPATIASLQQALNAPITVHILDANGQIEQTAQTKLGGTLNLQLIPLTASK